MSDRKKKSNQGNNLYCKYCKGRLRKLSYVPADKHMYHKKCYLDGIRWEAAKREMALERAQGKVREFPPVVLHNIERSICVASGLPANTLTHLQTETQTHTQVQPPAHSGFCLPSQPFRLSQ